MELKENNAYTVFSNCLARNTWRIEATVASAAVVSERGKRRLWASTIILCQVSTAPRFPVTKETFCSRCIRLDFIQSNLWACFYFRPVSPSGPPCFTSSLLFCCVVICCICPETIPFPTPETASCFYLGSPWASPHKNLFPFRSGSEWERLDSRRLSSYIPNPAFSLHIVTDKLIATLALLKCQSRITSLQHACKLLPVRTKLRYWMAASWLASPSRGLVPVTCHPA